MELMVSFDADEIRNKKADAPPFPFTRTQSINAWSAAGKLRQKKTAYR
jgi:hypothetical protein